MATNFGRIMPVEISRNMRLKKRILSMVMLWLPFILSMVNCSGSKISVFEKSSNFPFYVGTYTNTTSEGIYKYVLKENGTLQEIGLLAKTENPSFLAKSVSGKFLLAVNEVGAESGGGTISSFTVEHDTLRFLDKKSSGGSYPCFVTIHKNGFILTANYGDGKVGLLKLKKNGELSEVLDMQEHYGKGTTSRQEGPHAHSVWIDERENIISVDLGTNELWFSKIDPEEEKLVFQNQKKLVMAEGYGPRHMTFHPNGKWAYVVNELSSTVSFIERSDSGNYKLVSSISTLPDDFERKSTCADIHISKDGKFIYASNRGHDSIAIFSVGPEDGSLTLVGHESTRGKVPRNFSLSPDGRFLVVANQKTNSLVSFKRNESDGSLEFMDKIEASTPVCVLF